MAYFSNGSEGSTFEDQCASCKYGQAPCPVAYIQLTYNYDQVNDKTGTATEIMNLLVKADGTCTMREMCKQDFAIDPNQLSLF